MAWHIGLVYSFYYPTYSDEIYGSIIVALFEHKNCVNCKQLTLIEYDKNECIQCRTAILEPEGAILERLSELRELVISLKS